MYKAILSFTVVYTYIYIYFEFKSRNIIDKLHNRFNIQYIFYPIF